MPSPQISRRDFIALSTATTWGLSSSLAHASTPAHYPKSLKIVVPYSTGGGTDIIARHLAERLRIQTGVMALVDNKPGANGVIGTDLVAKSTPDGSTLVLVVNSHLLNPVVMSKLPFDTFKDLKGVTQVAVSPLVLVTGIKNEGAHVNEFLAAVRKSKVPVSYGSSENMTRLVGSMFVKVSGLDAVHIPYKGGGPLMTDVAAGITMLGVTSVLSAKQLIDSGRIKALAITGTERSRILSDTPTFREMGMEGFDKVTTSYSLYGPAGIPMETLTAVQAAVAGVLATADMRAILAAQAAMPVGNPVSDFQKQIPVDFEFWKKLALENSLERE
jgi:tripartite-type tricarboxylate transporter receptor subunit TctC